MRTRSSFGPREMFTLMHNCTTILSNELPSSSNSWLATGFGRDTRTENRTRCIAT